MERRLVTSHQENVPPRPAAPLKPGRAWLSPLSVERQRFLKSLRVGLDRGRDHWVPVWRPTRGGPAATPSLGTAPCQRPCRVQTNLASPRPRLGLALKDARQQSNVQPAARRPPRKARQFSVQQNLSPRLRAGFGPLASPPTATPCLGFRPVADFAPLSGCTWPDPGLMGAPLTLEDLTVPAQDRARALHHAATHLLLASGQHLEHRAARLGCRTSREPFARRGPCASDARPLPAHPQPHQPALASWGERRRPLGHGKTVGNLETPGGQCGPLVLPKTALWMLTRDLCDSEQGLPPAQPQEPGNRCPPESRHGRRCKGDPSIPQRAGSRETRLSSVAFPGEVLPGQERGRAPREPCGQKERTASGPPAPARSAGQCVVTLEPQAARWRLLSRCFRAWRHLAWKRRAVASALALRRRRLLQKGFQALRLQEAAWRQHMKALLAWSFREWRRLALQQKRGRPHIRAVPGPPAPGESGGGAAEVDPVWRSRCFGAWQQFVERGARYRRHLADRRAGTLRMCLGRWVQMKQLRASDQAKVTPLALCRQKAALCSSAPGDITARSLESVVQAPGLPQELGLGSVQEACQALALSPQASFFFHGIQEQTLWCILSWWRLRERGQDHCGSGPTGQQPQRAGSVAGSRP